MMMRRAFTMIGRDACRLGLALVSMTSLACARVDMVRLTTESFPAKHSVEEVEILTQKPTSPTIQLAELSMESTSVSFETMQEKILKKAATLGADAVVFSEPMTSVQRKVAYQPVYSPWSYYGPYYGPGAWGYGMGAYGWGYRGMYGPWGGAGYAGSTPVPYDVAVNRLKGTAIRYTNTR
jgi:hypothetical protein